MARFAWGGALLCGCVLLLGGCIHSTKPVFVRHYGLGGAEPAAATAGLASPSRRKILQVTSISVPPWLSGTGMVYRLDYRDDGRLSTYGRSNWVAPPATLLEPLIQNTLAAAGTWRAVVGPGSLATADASLHLQLDDFSQAFAQPDRSTGILDATATLIDNHDGNVIAQKHFRIEVAAATPDAQGGAKALGEASRKFATRLQQWLQAVDRRREPPANTGNVGRVSTRRSHTAMPRRVKTRPT
ncbi:MAG: ABC-type transport auxiliary lipoprotein family protein [Rhodanobacteraceae bacterium]